MSGAALVTYAVRQTSVWFREGGDPTVRVGLLWLAVLVPFLVLVRAPLPRGICAIVFSVIAGCTAFALYSAPADEAQYLVPGYFNAPDSVRQTLGYGPAANVVGRAKLTVKGKLAYDVKYSINRDGLRVAPLANNTPEGTVIFFGCSYTFGEGVQDAEAVPYQVGTLSGGRYKVYNFGFHGYGPHQMLRALESGMVEKIVKTKKNVTVIYQGMGDHVRRVVGLAPWDAHAPRYLLNEQGVARYSGHFDDDDIAVTLRKSSIFQLLMPTDGYGPDDIDVYAGVVLAASKEVKRRFPGAQFKVLFWDVDNLGPHVDLILLTLARWGLEVHRVQSAIPSPDFRKRYSLPGNHPNAAGNTLLAKYVLTNMLPASAEDGRGR